MEQKTVRRLTCRADAGSMIAASVAAAAGGQWPPGVPQELRLVGGHELARPLPQEGKSLAV